jgi:hypothetical protein
MKDKLILILSGLIMINTLLGKIKGEEDVFDSKDVFKTNETEQTGQSHTINDEKLKVQIIPSWDAFYEENGFVIQKGMD